MISPTLILAGYSIISSVVIVVLSALYHGCGSQAAIRNNSGEVDQRVEYDFGIINESVNNESGSDDQCHCWSGWELTVLELIVIGVLSIVGIGVAIKLMIHAKSWIMIKRARRSLKNEQKKQTKAEKMRKLILEEYRSSIPAHEVLEGKEEP
jgi:hypothetical protein